MIPTNAEHSRELFGILEIFPTPENSRFPFRTGIVGAHPDGHQHGVSIQISISFFFQIRDLIYRTFLIFILTYFEWRDTKNQQLLLCP